MKDLVKKIVENARGDNLYRAEMAFKRCTPKQMGEKYGQSGKTRQQILDEYKAWNDKIDACLVWLGSIEGEKG